MLKRIEKGESNGIVSWHLDRLARNSVDGGQIVYLLDIGKLTSLKFSSDWFENTTQGKVYAFHGVCTKQVLCKFIF